MTEGIKRVICASNVASPGARMRPRNLTRRKADVLHAFATEVDLWVASASATGDAHLVPLSFVWDGECLTLATPAHSRTARNLRRAGVTRVALGPTRDVVVIDGPVAVFSRDECDPALADAHATRTGFAPRTEPEEYLYLRLTPRTIQTWREADELPGRTVMRDGSWLID